LNRKRGIGIRGYRFEAGKILKVKGLVRIT